MTTLYDVAENTGVSTSTVSRVVNNYKYVRPEVRERVLRAIEELGYHPNKVAANLRRRHSNSVGVLLRQQRTPFSSELAYAIESTLFDQRYQTFLCSTDSRREKEEQYIQMLIEHKVHGVILRPSRALEFSKESISNLIDNDIRVVAVEIGLPDVKVSQILSDNIQGGYDGLNFLLGLGHRQIGIIAPEFDRDPDFSYPGNLRIRGSLQACEDAPDSIDPVFEFSDEKERFDAGYAAGKKLLQENPGVTAIFAITDMMAVGVMRAAKESGMSIPEDLSILGYDDVPIASLVTPRLTTIAQPIRQMGELAAQALLDLMNDKETLIRTITLENRLQIRDSTAKPR